MVEGDEMAFHNFYLALLRTLEVKKLVKYELKYIEFLQEQEFNFYSMRKALKHTSVQKYAAKCIKC